MAARLRWRNYSRILNSLQPVVIGKQGTNQPLAANLIPLNDDPRVGLRHAIIRYDVFTRRYTITDLNGPNSPFSTYIRRSNPDGSYRNNELVPHNHSSPLSPGDIIIVGQTPIFYEVVPVRTQQPGSLTPTGNRSQGSGGGVAFFILLILIVAGIYAAQNNSSAQTNSSSTPEKTLTAFCNAIDSGDYQTAYNQLSSRSRSQATEAQFAATLRQSISKSGGLKACLVSNVKLSQTTATGTITYTFGNGKTASTLDSLITEQSVWKIDSSKTVQSIERSLLSKKF